MNRRGEKKLKEEWRKEKKTYTRRELSDNVCVVCLCRIKFCRLHSSGTRKHSPETTNKQKSAIKGRKQKNKHGTVRKIEIEGGAAVFPSLHLHILSRGVGITAKNFICLFFFFGNQMSNGWFSNGGITTKYVGCLDQSVSLSFFEYVPGCI